MSQTTSTTNTATVTTPPAAKHLALANVVGSPGSTWASAAAIVAVVNNAMSNGLPTTNAGWVAFAVTLVMGIGGIFSKA